MSHMRQEIHEQPEVLRRLAEVELDNIKEIGAELARRDIRMVTIAARGTSDNATTYAKYLFGCRNGMPVVMAAPSIFTLYRASLRLQDTLLIGVSQSGEAPDVIEIVEEGRRMGAMTIALTNEPDSPLASAADRLMLCRAGREESVAATKTYTAELALFYLLSSFWSRRDDGVELLLQGAERMRQVFDLEADISSRCERYRYMDECLVIGRGLNYCTALETALKLKETCYILADSYSAADLMHGPIALVKPELPVIMLAPGGKAYPNMLSLAADLRERRAENLIFSDMPEILQSARTPFQLPPAPEEALSPLTAIAAAQLFCLSLAEARGIDPDSPRSLSKITRTR